MTLDIGLELKDVFPLIFTTTPSGSQRQELTSFFIGEWLKVSQTGRASAWTTTKSLDSHL